MKNNPHLLQKQSRVAVGMYIYFFGGQEAPAEVVAVLGWSLFKHLMEDSLVGDRMENWRGGSKFSEGAVVTRQEVVRQPRLLHSAPIL